MKKIALLTPSLGTYSETFVKMQIEELPASLVLHGDKMPTLINGERILNPSKIQKLNNIIYSLFTNKSIYDYEYFLKKRLNEENIDTVLIQFGDCAAEFIPFCIKNNLRVVVHFHGRDAYMKELIKVNKEKYDKVFNYSKAIVAVSQDMKKQLMNLGCSEQKIHVFPCAPDDLFLSVENDYSSNIFFAVGRFVNKKAPYLTLLAFKKLLSKHPAAILNFGGDGILLESCINLAKILEIEGNVNFLGVLSQEQVKENMSKSLAFVQHSITALDGDSEGTPVAVLEASLAGLPVIATNHAGIKDVVIDQKTGLLCNEMDIEKMSENMAKVFENRRLAKELGEAGKKFVQENFSQDIYISKLRDLLQ